MNDFLGLRKTQSLSQYEEFKTRLSQTNTSVSYAKCKKEKTDFL